MASNQDNVPNATNVDFSGQSKSPEQATTDHSPPMAVLPLNPSAKLDQEPNPFEQSFSTVATTPSERQQHHSHHSTNDNNNNNNNKRSESLSSSSTTTSDSSSHIHLNNNHSTTTSPTTSNHQLQQQKTILPPVAAITSPVPPLLRSGVLPKDVANQIAWNSLRTGPLSPSMLQGPQKPSDFEGLPPPSTSSSYSTSSPTTTTTTTTSSQHNHQRPMSHIYAPDPALSFAMAGPVVEEMTSNGYVNARSSSMSSSASAPNISPTATTHHGGMVTHKQDERRPSEPIHMTTHDTHISLQEEDEDDEMTNNNNTTRTKKRTRSSNDKEEEDEKRKNFLERNRIAALKCRQRKKQWLNNLQAKVEYLTTDNEQLQIQANALREEIVNLKTLLLAHKDCPIAQQQQQDVFHGLQQQQQHKSSSMTTLIHSPTESTRYSSSSSSNTTTPIHNNNNNNNNAMQQNMMTFSSHPQPQSMVAGTSSILRF
ncbi:hypothetical protein BDA99DRAFT_563549 [Phascolomyces articulosus]|uniref:BZIP domain-containing protein n=1 Tax=Phascolomyces articulosus TaxID=60185 RepID=A0AAD5K292_9FUNG|nr:hypothetical protein BDA99DRAFT_563549 [Phascolomyces articulosus]